MVNRVKCRDCKFAEDIYDAKGTKIYNYIRCKSKSKKKDPRTRSEIHKKKTAKKCDYFKSKFAKARSRRIREPRKNTPEYILETLKRRGFTTHWEYEQYITSERGFSSPGEYRQSLWKKKGFKRNIDYKNYLARKRGYRDYKHLREEQLKKKAKKEKEE